MSEKPEQTLRNFPPEATSGWDADVTPEAVAEIRRRAAGVIDGQEWEPMVSAGAARKT